MCEMHDIPEKPEIPEMSGIPERSDIPEMSGIPERSDIPGSPELSKQDMCIRARVFRRAMDRLEKRPSGLLMRLEAQILTCVTAKAFCRRGKMVFHRSARKALELYTDCTVAWVEELAGRDRAYIRGTARRLYRLSYRLGRCIRRVTGFTRAEDLQRLVFVLYRHIAIEMRGEIPGQILVSACSFSRRYTPAQCRMMSNMDHGVIAGICGGGKLAFSQRLTEGCENCAACFRQGGTENVGAYR